MFPSTKMVALPLHYIRKNIFEFKSNKIENWEIPFLSLILSRGKSLGKITSTFKKNQKVSENSTTKSKYQEKSKNHVCNKKKSKRAIYPSNPVSLCRSFTSCTLPGVRSNFLVQYSVQWHLMG